VTRDADSNCAISSGFQNRDVIESPTKKKISGVRSERPVRIRSKNADLLKLLLLTP
jgi:hypothetical protein